ncbi:MAG: 30S ribosomal protein S8e [Candidatus Altiarchaeales archaeon]|nr:30S ribosomal protein S8e [Candidatus Altiarchaeales archaeon]
MVLYHNTHSRARKKRKYGAGGKPVDTTIGVVKKRKFGVKGGNEKLKLFACKTVNTLLGGKYVKCEVVTVKENPSNKDFVRRNVITKGAVVLAKGPDGKELNIRVTSRPGQDGVLNGVVV